MAIINESPGRSVLAFHNFKEAALLFDRVIFPSIDWIQTGIVKYNFLSAAERRLAVSNSANVILSKTLTSSSQAIESVPVSVFLELVYGSSSGAKIADLYDHYSELMAAYRTYTDDIVRAKLDFMSSQPQHRWLLSPRSRSIVALYLKNHVIAEGVNIRTLVGRLGSRIKVEKPDIILPLEIEGESQEGRSVLAKLSGILRVDTADVSWEQILEIRRDKESIEKLAFFRRWSERALEGLSTAQILEELSIAESNFKSACRKHDLRYKSDLVTELFDEKFLFTLGGIGVLAASIHGVPVRELVSQLATYAACGAAGAAGFAQFAGKIGKVGFSFEQKKLEAKKLQREHPVVYLLDITERLDAN